MLLLLLLSVVNARQWSPAYVNSLLEGRQCLTREHLVLMDSFIDMIRDTKDHVYYSARTISLLLHRLDRQQSLCDAMVDTASSLYHELSWQKGMGIRRLTQKMSNATLVTRNEYDTVIDTLRESLSSDRIRRECASFAPLTVEERARLYKCMRGVRKESIWAYTKYTE